VQIQLNGNDWRTIASGDYVIKYERMFVAHIVVPIAGNCQWRVNVAGQNVPRGCGTRVQLASARSSTAQPDFAAV
jgi:hypothetical protein